MIFITIYFWLISAFSVILTFCILVILYPFISQKRFARLYEGIPGTIVLYAMMIPGFWKAEYRDLRKHKNWSGKQYILVANHVSFIDSLMITMIPLTKKFMIARIFTNIPIFGWLALKSGFVPVDRNQPNRLSSIENSGVYRAKKTIEDGSSFVLFPEGRRALLPYKLEEFKTGAFILSKETGIPILPICLKGTYEALRFGGIASWSNITVTIGEPFHVTDIPKDIQHVRDFIEEHLG